MYAQNTKVSLSFLCRLEIWKESLGFKNLGWILEWNDIRMENLYSWKCKWSFILIVLHMCSMHKKFFRRYAQNMKVLCMHKIWRNLNHFFADQKFEKWV